VRQLGAPAKRARSLGLPASMAGFFNGWFMMKADLVTLGAAEKPFSPRVVIRKWLIFAAIALMTLTSTRLMNAQGLFYVVNTTSDTVVVGACANGNAGCSLRGAIQEANFHVGDDGIGIDLPAGSVINLTSALPDLTESVGITGPARTW
jgi:CSLREA domain-containing protein